MLIKIIKSQRGFGFFGMMVLVIFMAVAASIVMVSMRANVSNQALQETISKMERLQVALTKYVANVGSGPPLNALSNLYAKTSEAACLANSGSSTLTGWCGPYLDQVTTNDSSDLTVDGWGTAFVYSYNSLAVVGSRNTLTSYGPNKASGGGDDISRTF